MDLKEQHCEACRIGAPLLTVDELTAMLPQIPDWCVVNERDIDKLERIYEFKNFAQAYAFTCRIAELSESEGHHPSLLLEWGKVTVRWWTHKINGLHKNDVIMAVKTDALMSD